MKETPDWSPLVRNECKALTNVGPRSLPVHPVIYYSFNALKSGESPFRIIGIGRVKVSACCPVLVQQSSFFSFIETDRVRDLIRPGVDARMLYGCNRHLLRWAKERGGEGGFFLPEQVSHISLSLSVVGLAEHAVILVWTNVKHELCWRNPGSHCDPLVAFNCLRFNVKLVHSRLPLWQLELPGIWMMNFQFPKLLSLKEEVNWFHFNDRVPLDQWKFIIGASLNPRRLLNYLDDNNDINNHSDDPKCIFNVGPITVTFYLFHSDVCKWVSVSHTTATKVEEILFSIDLITRIHSTGNQSESRFGWNTYRISHLSCCWKLLNQKQWNWMKPNDLRNPSQCLSETWHLILMDIFKS